MRYNKNGCDIMFPPCRCTRKGCDSTMIRDKGAPDHYKSTGNYRYKCKEHGNHLRWMNPTEIQTNAI